MKTSLVVLFVLMVGCAAPRPPSAIYMVEEIMAGRMKADDVNKAWDDYYRASAEYENSIGYKLGTGVLLLGLTATSLAANSGPYGYGCGYRGGYLGGYSSPSKIVVGTTPTAGGGSLTTIKAYK